MGVDRRAESGSRKAPERTGGQKEIAALVGTTRRQRPSCLILVRRLGRLNFRRTCLIRCRTSSRSLWGAATPRVALPRYPTNGSAYKYNTGNHLFPRGSRMITSSGYRAVGRWQRSLVHASRRARRLKGENQERGGARCEGAAPKEPPRSFTVNRLPAESRERGAGAACERNRTTSSILVMGGAVPHPSQR